VFKKKIWAKGKLRRVFNRIFSEKQGGGTGFTGVFDDGETTPGNVYKKCLETG
jgi:hypothetical protein